MIGKKKSNTKKFEVTPTSHIFDIKDRYFNILDVMRKKIRFCDKKIRENETALLEKRDKDDLTAISEREERIKLKKMEHDIWCEVVQSIVQVRQMEREEGLMNLDVSEVSNGLALLEEVEEKQDFLLKLNQQSKKYLLPTEIEKIINLSKKLRMKNIICHFDSFSNVFKLLETQGNDDTNSMTFSSFLKLSDKTRKTLALKKSVETDEHNSVNNENFDEVIPVMESLKHLEICETPKVIEKEVEKVVGISTSQENTKFVESEAPEDENANVSNNLKVNSHKERRKMLIKVTDNTKSDNPGTVDADSHMEAHADEPAKRTQNNERGGYRNGRYSKNRRYKPRNYQKNPSEQYESGNVNDASPKFQHKERNQVRTKPVESQNRRTYSESGDDGWEGPRDDKQTSNVRVFESDFRSRKTHSGSFKEPQNGNERARNEPRDNRRDDFRRSNGKFDSSRQNNSGSNANKSMKPTKLDS